MPAVEHDVTGPGASKSAVTGRKVALHDRRETSASQPLSTATIMFIKFFEINELSLETVRVKAAG